MSAQAWVAPPPTAGRPSTNVSCRYPVTNLAAKPKLRAASINRKAKSRQVPCPAAIVSAAVCVPSSSRTE